MVAIILIATIVLQWRNAMGVGNFLMAQLINSHRNYLLSYSKVVAQNPLKIATGTSMNISEDKKDVEYHYRFLTFLSYLTVVSGVVSLGVLASTKDLGNAIVVFGFALALFATIVTSHVRKSSFDKIASKQEILETR